MKKLSDKEWAFHKLSATDDLDLVHEWEIQRSAGSGLRPWLDLKADERKRVFDYKHRHDGPIKEKDWNEVRSFQDFQQLFEQFNDTHTRCGLPARRHVLEIDWGARRKLLRDAFDRLLEQYGTQPESKGGRNLSSTAKGKLLDLAALRLTQADYTPDAMLASLAPVIKWAGFVKTTGGKLSVNHRAQTFQKVKAEIAERKFSP
jgi:hypothetical protein